MRLVLVWRGDPGGYRWAPTLRSHDVVVAFDDLALSDFGHEAIRFDDLETWHSRNEDEARIVRAFQQLLDNPALQSLEVGGCRLTDFFEFSLRAELAHVVRGWTAARSAPHCTAVVADPACPPAVAIGAHAALGLGAPHTHYVPDHFPTWQSSLPRRLVGNGLVHVASRIPRDADVRIATTSNYKITPALAAVDARALRRLGVAGMPLPGFDPRETLRTAAHLRLPVLRTLAPISQRRAPPVDLPGDVSVSTGIADLDGAFGEVAVRLTRIAWPQMWQAMRATEALEVQGDLRALLMPAMFSGTPRAFTAWARQHGIRLGVLQHGLYAHRRFTGADRGADIVMAWGDGVEEQARDWGGPRAAFRTIGSPSVQATAILRTRSRRVRRVLLTTTGPHRESVIFPTAIHDTFLEAVLPGIKQIQRCGIDVALRVAPSETQGRYRQALARAGVVVSLPERAPIADAITQHDLLVCPLSSVALEASALGVPVLMYLPPMPSEFAREHLVAPWAESLPGMFHDSAEFLAIVDGIGGENPPAIAVGLELASHLSEYAQPFDADAFMSALGELSA